MLFGSFGEPNMTLIRLTVHRIAVMPTANREACDC
jgi:hypothetical protein